MIQKQTFSFSVKKICATFATLMSVASFLFTPVSAFALDARASIRSYLEDHATQLGLDAFKKRNDRVSPTISITTPAANATISGNTTISMNAADNVGVAAIDVYIDGALLAEITGTPYNTAWNTTTAPDGVHTISTTARDAAGNTQTASVQVTTHNAAAPVTPTASVNLIQNPSFADAVGGIPTAWNQGSFGTSTVTFTYPAVGHDATPGASITISNYQSGDAKWFFNDVPINQTSQYQFSDFYMSSIPSQVFARYAVSGAFVYVPLATLPAATSWQQFQMNLTPPAGATSVTIFHSIAGVGTMSVDQYDLHAINASTADAFDKGYVTFTFDDGWMSQYDNALPMLQNAGFHATFYIISDYMLHSETNLLTDPEASSDLQITKTSRSVMWDPIYPDPTQDSFDFTDTYSALSPSTVVVSYTDASSTPKSLMVGTLPAGINVTGHLSFTLPATDNPIGITHSVTTGTLTVQSATLKEPTGYMGTVQVLSIKNAGNEIGDHTRDHTDLTLLTQAQDSDEIVGAKNDLTTTLGTPVDTFAYPYGSYNAAILQILKGNGFIGARGTDIGFDSKTTDPFALMAQEVNNQTTALQIESWIDAAVKDKKWLILELHQVDQSGLQYATTPQILSQVITYLKTSPASVITLHQGLSLMKQ